MFVGCGGGGIGVGAEDAVGMADAVEVLGLGMVGLWVRSVGRTGPGGCGGS